jgi:amidohydrolase
VTSAPTLARLALLAALLPLGSLGAQSRDPIDAEIDRRTNEILPKVVAWRRDFHQNPELSNRETRTGKVVADYLRTLGLEVKDNVAHHGVVAVLRGGRPGPVVALRADMDALPVTEEVDLPFKSKVRTTFNGQDVGVMHACGHDTHTAMLMGAATVLAAMKDKIPGTVKFIFQPAEEGLPAGERGGAAMMIEEGVLENPKVDAIFGQHVFSSITTGVLGYRSGGIMASNDQLRIVVRGRQTHGALPWGGVDPIVVASQIVTGLQTIVSRQIDLTNVPAVVTIGQMHGGVRFNIIPDSVYLEGTIRTFDTAVQKDIHARVKRTAEGIAQSAGAVAEVTITTSSPVTYNDPALTARIVPTLERVVGKQRVEITPPTTTAEDFALYQTKVPGVFYFVGATPAGQDPMKAPRNHSPKFFADEALLPTGVRSLVYVAMDYLKQGK